MTGPILHICSPDEWDDARRAGARLAPSLATEGFVHCSLPRQLAGVAARRFAGVSDATVLVIDPERLDAPVVLEDSYGSGDEFPHVHGPITVEAVVEVVGLATALRRSASGRWVGR